MPESIYLRVQIIYVMQHNRLKAHGSFRRAPFIFSVMAEYYMQNKIFQFFRKIRYFIDRRAHYICAQDYVAYQPAFIRIIKTSLICKLLYLAYVMKRCAA